MNASRIRPWLWFAAVWLGTLALAWSIDRVVRSLYVMMFAFCGSSLAVSILPGIIGGYYRNWFVTLAGTPALVVAIGLGDRLQGILAGTTPIGSVIPRAGDFLTIAIASAPMLLIASLSHFLVSSIKRRHPPGHCQKCGYDLTGNVSGVCSECGEPIPDAARATGTGAPTPSAKLSANLGYEIARRRRIRLAVTLTAFVLLGFGWLGIEFRNCWHSGIALARLKLVLCEYIKAHGHMPDGWEALEKEGLIRKLDSGDYETTAHGNLFIHGDSIVDWSVRVEDLQLINLRHLVDRKTGRPRFIIRRIPGILLRDAGYTMKTNVILYNALFHYSSQERVAPE